MDIKILKAMWMHTILFPSAFPKSKSYRWIRQISDNIGDESK